MTYKIRKYAEDSPTDYDGWLRQQRYRGMESAANVFESFIAKSFNAITFFNLAANFRQSYPVAKNSKDSELLHSEYLKLSRSAAKYAEIIKKCKIENKKKQEVLKFIEGTQRNIFNTKLEIDSFFKEQEKGARQNFADMIAVTKYYIQECTKKKSTNMKKNKRSINKYSQVMLYTNKTGYHNEFYRDALKGLGSSDPLLKNFYKGLQQEYYKDLNIKPQSRGDLMDFFYEQEHIMCKAHPDSIVIADARDGGELLENNLEKHKKLVDISQRRPLGNFK